MSASVQHSWDLVSRIALDREPDVYPPQLFIVAVDMDNLSANVVEQLDEGKTALVVLEDAGQCLFTPEPGSWLRRRVDRMRGRIRVRVELRPSQGPSRSWRAAVSRSSGFDSAMIPRSL